MVRKPRGYDGTDLTSKTLQNVLPTLLGKVKKSYVCGFKSIQTVWPSLVGPRFASLTVPMSLQCGALTVLVKNSTLYSHLCRFEKANIISQLQKQFPKSGIQDVVFRMG